MDIKEMAEISAILILLFIFLIGLCIGYKIGKNTIDHEMHTELCMLRQNQPLNDDDLECIVTRLNRIERKADRALDQNKIQGLRLDKLENNTSNN